MKKLTSQSIFLLFAALFVAGSMMSSCKKDKTTTATVNKTALHDSIAAANALLAGSVEGSAAGDYQLGSKATLQATITAVQTIYDASTSTQSDIDNAVANLNLAVVAFKAKLVIPIAEENLIAQWTFDEGSGTTAKDASSNHLDGTLMPGHHLIVGSGILPTWTSDRYGTANHALHFAKGGHIEVPFKTVLNPSSITIALWIKADTIWANNYFISQNWWLGFKFQLQDHNKPFFTYFTGAGSVNKDWNVDGLPTNEWHHIAVTLKPGEEDYYLDGQSVYSWTDAAVALGIGTIVNPEAFCIGQGEPNVPIVAPADDPAQYGVNFFIGSLDDIRIYNTSLSATQISSIYNVEKPAK